MKKHFHPLSAISGIFPSHSKKGLEPGSLLHTGKKKMGKIHIQLLEYDEKNSIEKEISSNSLPDLSKNKLQWLSISGLHDTKLLETIGNKYGLHSLLLEDILNTNGRPKLDEIEDVILIVVKILKFDEANNNLSIEQISLIFGKDFVLSFQE
ncbi:MAG: hypothetical protein KAS32_20640, partial [Candidatus Peribacteraceae bacterium]|nr:hypothetical protein [Candidatus Peribacteraceae bacterium]